MIKRITAIVALALTACLVLSGCAFGKKGGSVTIATKQYTESVILGEMYAQLIEHHTDLDVVRKPNLGTTAVCFAAMEKGEIDIYVEYTGTICSEILRHQHEGGRSHGESLETIAEEMNELYDVKVYRPIGLSNNYALGMQRDKAESLGIAAISDLAAVSQQMVFAANDLFYNRIGDGYDAMSESYGMTFGSLVKMSNASSYEAIANDRVDVMVAYQTDPQLTKYDMVILEDDKDFFPEYYALPIIENAVLKKYPRLDSVLDLLAGSIDTERMRELNYLVDMEGKSCEEVAAGVLAELGLLG